MYRLYTFIFVLFGQVGGRVGELVLDGHRTRETIVLRSVYNIVERLGSPRSMYMLIGDSERVYVHRKQKKTFDTFIHTK